ncbi:MAG TPA: suppressor of fused domain protein [Bryobacteraceae bacterium]|nr:suppressor of fused domain protein [Bryobacteraceae bacterium]
MSANDVFPGVPRSDVYTFARSSPQGEVFALATSGMSDLAMRVPPAAGKDTPRRVEPIFYCTEPTQEYLETLRWAARFPHDQKTWLGCGHTIPNNPPAPFWGSEILGTLLFMPTIVNRERALPEQLMLDGDPDHFLWGVPLSAPECHLKLKRGFNAILDLFENNRHPHIFDPVPKSYV